MVQPVKPHLSHSPSSSQGALRCAEPGNTALQDTLGSSAPLIHDNHLVSAAPHVWLDAAFRGRVRDLRKMLVKTPHASIANRQNALDATFVAAVLGGQVACARDMVQQGASVGVRVGVAGNTPLMLAVDNDDLPMVKALLQLHADPNESNLFDYPVQQRALDSEGSRAAAIHQIIAAARAS